MINNGSLKMVNEIPGKLNAYSGLGLFILIAALVYSFTTMAVPVGQPNKENKPDFKYKDTMEKCQNENCWEFGLTLLLAFALFVGFYMFQRVLPISGFVIIIIMSIVAIAGINSWNKLDTLFEKMKFYSIIIATIILAFTRVSNITNLTNNKTAANVWCWLLWLILAANIGEAVYSELDEGYILNPVVGIILILLMPNPILTGKSWNDILFVDKGNYRDLVYKTPLFWAFLYTIWNANYAYGDKREHFAIIIMVLLSAFLNTTPNSLSVNPSLYIQARAYTLFMRYMVVAYRDVFEEYTDSKGWYDEKAKTIWDGINISLAIIFIVYTMVTNKRFKSMIGSNSKIF